MSIELKCLMRVKGSWNHPRGLCGKPGADYEVRGKTYTCRTVLCDAHAKVVIKEGFTLTPVSQNA